MAVEAPDRPGMLGFGDVLSLDSRQRFRLPDHVAVLLRSEMMQGSDAAGGVPPVQRIGLYLVPGTKDRIMLFSPRKVGRVVERFESPRPGTDVEKLRAARDYFYAMARYVEADRQNRVQIPEHLLTYAGITEEDRQIMLISHRDWLSISRRPVADEIVAQGKQHYEQMAPDAVDPAEPPVEARNESGAQQ